MALDRDKKLLEAQTKDAQTRLDEAETNALKGLHIKTIFMFHSFDSMKVVARR